LIAFVFSLVLDAPSLGNNFPLFYATGFLPFILFNDIVNKLASAIRFSKPLLAYPSVTYLDALVGRFCLNVLTHALVTIIILAGIETIFSTGAAFQITPILNAFAMAAVLALGVGTLNCFLLSRFPVWDRLWQIVTRPLFIISGIFFVFEDLPRNMGDLAWFNPLLHVTGEMRRGVYANYEASYASAAFVYAIGLSCLALGLMLLNTHQRRILNS
jgi:capsular polysaccharide transport system permease protein